MGYWKSKVLPKIKMVFDKNSAKKTAASQATKSFDDSKEELNKEFEDKKTDLHPKVLDIYQASSTEIKALVKDPKEAELKKHSAAVTNFIHDLAKIEFPGSKPVAEACTKFGPSLVPGPVFFVFEKVSTFIVVEDKPEEEAAPAVEEAASREVAVEEEPKKEEMAAEETKKEGVETTPTPEPEK